MSCLKVSFLVMKKACPVGLRGDKLLGKLQLASNGTLFLDEIGDMPFDMQVKLHRVLQSGELQRVETFVSSDNLPYGIILRGSINYQTVYKKSADI